MATGFQISRKGKAMSIRHTLTALALCAAMASTSVAAPPPDKGGGKGGGNGGGGEDPPAEPFAPAIAYFEDGRKYKDLMLANRAGDQACLVIRTEQGVQELRGFGYHAAGKLLAYSKDDKGIYLASWDTDPCRIGEGTLIRSQANPETLDFSPSGRYLIWSEGDPNYNGLGSAFLIFIYDTEQQELHPLPLREWAAMEARFTPSFATSGEIVFSGGPLDMSEGAYNSLFLYDIGAEIQPSSNPRKLFDGGAHYIDHIFSVTNPGGIGEPSVTITDNDSGKILQVSLDTGISSELINGNEPAYNCDNSALIHQFSGKGSKSGIYITSVEGSYSDLWSSGNYRFFDWFCP